MSEGKISDSKHLAQIQYANPGKLSLRRAVFDFAVPKIDFNEEIIKILNLKGNESVLDAGCGDGNFLIKLRKEKGHNGRLVGVDISAGMFEQTRRLSDKLNLDLEFIEKSADNLKFKNECFDVVVSLFMIYHMPDIKKALNEWKRVLKKDGKLILATNSLENRKKFQLIKKLISKKMGRIIIPQFAVRFSLEEGKNILKELFTIESKFTYEAELRIPDARYVIDSTRSIKDMYDPLPTKSEWGAIEHITKREVEREIKEKEYFSDNLKRGFFVCSKK